MMTPAAHRLEKQEEASEPDDSAQETAPAPEAIFYGRTKRDQIPTGTLVTVAFLSHYIFYSH